MTLRPFSATLQNQFRTTLETPGSPETIDDSQPVIPVAVVAQVNTASSASFTQITDGTDTATVTTAGELNVKQTNFSKGDSTQTIVTVASAAAGTSIAAGASTLLRTNTGGKKVYITSINIGGSATVNLAITILDSATVKLPTLNGAVLTQNYVFPTPIQFDTDIRISHNNGAAQTLTYQLNGWEE
jgi:hypothetical protein